MATLEHENIIEQQNGTCECASLSAIFHQQAEVETLMEVCDTFEREAYLAYLREDDLDFYLLYQTRLDQLLDAHACYNQIIDSLIDTGMLALYLHENQKDKFQIRKKEALLALADGKETITIHCTSCGQQIDIAAHDERPGRDEPACLGKNSD